MITYKPIIIQGGRRKDGTYPVKIRVTFKGVSRRIPTTLVCTDADLTRSGKIKNPTILQRAGELIVKMRSTCEGLSPFTLEDWTVDDVVRHIRDELSAEQFRLDFFTYADDWLRAAGMKPQTREKYGTALNALARFLGKRELDVNAITRGLLLDFVAFVDAEPRMHGTPKGKVVASPVPKKVQGGASALHLMKLARIFNAAKFRYNDDDTGRILIPRSPFDGLKKAYPPGQGSRPLEVEEMQRIIDAGTEDWMERDARAAFLLSFCTMGANLVDLRKAPALSAEVWKYNRTKTEPRRADRAEARVSLPPEISSFVGDLKGQSGQNTWWLPELHRWNTANIATAMINRALRKILVRLEIDTDRVTFYSARHTWATLARRIGVEKATVDEALTHVGDFRVTDMYAERNWALAWEANRKVLDLFVWPDNYRTKTEDTDGK